MINLATNAKITWCNGCFNFFILEGVKNVISGEIEKGKKKDDFCIVSGIGCHAKIFDYINLNGLNSLHGRVIPTCLGMKIGNPNLNVIGFAGDGDAYAEGIEHLIHAARYNANFKYFVHDNRVFALTVGQPTPTTEIGFKDKTTPGGVKVKPMNPIKIMLASGCTFVARTFADTKQIAYVFSEALKHNGFAFIEVIQPCLIFHLDKGIKKRIYSLEEEGHNKKDYKKAMGKAEEFDYNDGGRIPTGIFYQEERETFEEGLPQLKELMKKKSSWKDIKR